MLLGVVGVIRKLEDGTPTAKALDEEVVTITINPYRVKGKQQPILWRDFDTTEPLVAHFAIGTAQNDFKIEFPREWYATATQK